MMLKYYNNIIPAKDQICEIQALAWSSNCKKMAVATGDLVISLFSETCEQKDKFATKPCDSKYPKNSYIITGIAFSFDGQKLAVAQSDNIIFVYKIGENWGDKKVICNKFFQQTAVTCLIWPKNQEILFGAYDGKVRIANTLTNKSSTLYNSESFVVSMSANVHGTSIISGHADCKVVRCHLQKSEDISSSQGCVFVHSCSPYVLIHTNQKGTIIAAGCDKRIVAYSEDGTPIQTFDYSKQVDECAFSVGKLSNSGQTFVVGSYNRIRLFTWSSRRGMWNEEIEKYIENLYTISALVWKPDDSKIIIGTLCGAVEVIDCCLKRLNYRNKLEITYVGVTQVLVQPIGLNKVGDANDRIIIKSRYESAIDDIKPCPGERYIVAHTSETLIVVDIVLKRLLEVPWLNADDEKYIYHNDAVFMVYTSGELILLEFNKEEILGSVRTEFLHHDLLSIRINEKRMLVNDSAVKIMGYMVDKTTFAIIDLVDNNTVTQYEHSSKIRWLVINETCRYVLFLDKMLHLNLYKIPYDEVKDVKGSVFSDTLIFPLLNYCSWVNWVKGSDVIVAQTHASICIWYNIDTPDHYVTIPIKGDVVELKYSENNVVSVITSSGPTQQDTHSYPLDDGLVEFGTAIEDSDLNRAVRFLEAKENNKEKTLTQNTLQSFTPLWRKLAELSLKNGQLFITWRCYSALEDWPRADFLFETICLSLKNYGELNMNDYKIKARVALFDNNLKLTEQIYLENNNVDGIIDLYLKMDKWTEAIDIAKFKSHPRLETLQKDYYNWLVANNQKDKAGDLLSKFGDLKGALNLFMKANRPSRAAMILMQNLQMLDEDQSLLDRLCSALIKSECYQRAGELLEKCDRASEAMSCYKKGKIFRRAIELCRKIEPENVTKMEEKWGDHLFTEKQYDEAINHYIEAGNSFKAVESSIKAKQWNKSLSIIQINKDYKNSKTHFLLLANYFQSIQEFDTAEKLYLDIGDALNVVKMYQESERWSDAHRIASSYMEKNELIEMYSKQAELMENSEKYKEAENLYVEMEQPAKAIIMYKKRNMYKEMVRLVKQYFPDKYVDTQKHLAKDYERSGRLLEAEKLLIEVSDWPNAIKMYRNKNRWEDAYRISKEHAPINAQAKVAYAWAKAVGSSTAKKLLDHYDCLEIAINHACTNNDFDMAYELITDDMVDKLNTIKHKHALFFEDEKQYKEAEEKFIEAGKPKEAVLMYLQAKDWTSAREVAEKYVPETLGDVLIGEAKLMFAQKNYSQGEALFLRAKMVNICIEMYQEAEMWEDALRLCKEYLPNKMTMLERKYEEYMASAGKQIGAEKIIKQARIYESSGQYTEAVSTFMKLTKEHTSDTNLLIKVWNRARELSLKFLGSSESTRISELVATKLIGIGKQLNASEVYLSLGLHKKAIFALVDGKHWERALKLAANIDPKLHELIETKFKKSLVNAGKVDQLVEVDPEAAVKVYASNGQWDKCFKLAERMGKHMLGQYITICANSLIEKEDGIESLMVFCKYGIVTMTENIKLYKAIFANIIEKVELKNYGIWAALRTLFFKLYTSTDWSQESKEILSSSSITNINKIFEPYFLVSHYGAIRATCMDQAQGMKLAAKLSLACLRFCDIIPQDKAFYDAGSICKAAGVENVAFVLLNHFVDISEAIIEASNKNFLDISEFTSKTDFMCESKIPTKCYCSDTTVESIREWLLATSINTNIEQTLPVEANNKFESTLPQNSKFTDACIISGYPLEHSAIKFKNSSNMANKDDWNKYVMNAKVSKSDECQNVMTFIDKWNGPPTSPSSLTLI